MIAKRPKVEILVRSYIALLRREAAEPPMPDNSLADFLHGPRREIVRTPPPLKPDHVAAAVMLARTLRPVNGLPGGLADSNPVIALDVPAADWVGPMEHVVETCAIRPGRQVRNRSRVGAHGPGTRREFLIIGRDGSSTTQRPDQGNDAVGDAIQAGHPVIGIAPDARRLLPSDLVRAAEHRLQVPPLDPGALALVIEAVVGTRPTREIDAGLAAACNLGDLRLAIHASRGADGSLDRLEAILRKGSPGHVGGPRLEDLVGYGEALPWGIALVDDLRRWRAGEIRFRDCSSAILLSGPPGCGKTQFALAVSRGTGLPLRAGSLGQWQGARDGHLGHTLGAMRAFFEVARREPCIALIDEIDSFGDRNSFPEHNRDYSTQIVNALLEHLDGAVAREGVVVIGATNHPHRLDPAIRRSGRLDRHVRIGLPGIDDLAGIFRQYLGDDLAKADLRSLAVQARGMTGADVEAVIRRARGHARRRMDATLALDDLRAAMVEDRPVMSETSRLRATVHEAGHGLASVSSGMARSVALSVHATGGLTETVPFDDAGGTASEIETALVVILAGRAAEQVILGDVSAGAAGDLATATRLAGLMEMRWGFSRTSPLVSVGDGAEVDVARMPWLMPPIQSRLNAAYERALALMEMERPALERLAGALHHSGHLEDAEVRAIIDGRACAPSGPASFVRRA